MMVLLDARGTYYVDHRKKGGVMGLGSYVGILHGSVNLASQYGPQ